ncbi:Hypp6413 [Branchiostoma lanceolatum]|uniref:Hypp6413 protein n=1 Tax=Branchiostoma lanceolatum TaxID=7740 RepID=A0A8J9YU19_BRALA|nr:Hypp6413 [Branchiostoma lanceolatum]
MSSDTYEEAEAVKLKKLPVQKARQQRERGAKSRLEAINAEEIRRHADLSSKDTAYQGSAIRRRVFCDVINAHSCCLAAILAVIVSQVTVGLVLMMIINAQFYANLISLNDANDFDNNVSKDVPRKINKAWTTIDHTGCCYIDIVHQRRYDIPNKPA